MLLNLVYNLEIPVLLPFFMMVSTYSGTGGEDKKVEWSKAAYERLLLGFGQNFKNLEYCPHEICPKTR